MHLSSQNKIAITFLVITVVLINIVGLVIVLRDSNNSSVLGVVTKEKYLALIDLSESNTAVAQGEFVDGEVVSVDHGELQATGNNFILTSQTPVEFIVNQSNIDLIKGDLALVTKANYNVTFSNEDLVVVSNSQIKFNSTDGRIEVIEGMLIWNETLILKGEYLEWQIDTWKVIN